MSISNEKASLYTHFLSSGLPRLETEILAAFALGLSREKLLQLDIKTPLSAAVSRRIRRLEAKRLGGWPIAYLIGYKEFYGLDLAVNPAVLIPRPETEMIVDEILSILPDGPATVVDIGTGSGAIVLASACEAKRRFPAVYRRSSFSGLDISPAALKVAKKNAKRYRLDKKVSLFRSNLLENINPKIQNTLKGRLIITANLPYLTPQQINASPSIQREPRLALDGGKDGLKLYRRLFTQIKMLQADAEIIIFCEIDSSQAEPITSIARRHFPGGTVEIKSDLAGLKRLAIIKIPR